MIKYDIRLLNPLSLIVVKTIKLQHWFRMHKKKQEVYKMLLEQQYFSALLSLNEPTIRCKMSNNIIDNIEPESACNQVK